MTAWTQTPADHVTEREPDGTWEDCVAAAGLELVRAGSNDRTIPATRAEKEALRAAMGLPEEHHGATLEQLARGIDARYGSPLGYRITRDWLELRDHLRWPGTIAVVLGSMGALGAHWRR